MKSIGIPRCLYYYYFPELWESFFSKLGFKPVVSSPTTRQTIELAGRISEAEHCLPIKLFDAHISQLVDKTDFIFVPRLHSILKGHISCPKLSVLPDVAEIIAPGKIITIEINENKMPIRKSLFILTKKLKIKKKLGVSVINEAVCEMEDYFKTTINHIAQNDNKKFLILGHPYTLSDTYISGPILKKIRDLKASYECINFKNEIFDDPLVRWDTCGKMNYKLKQLDPNEYHGIIQISSFNCGCDSIMIELFRRMMRKRGIPYLIIVVDEHTSLAGIDTRIEAFIDSIRWQNGQVSYS